MTWEIGYKDKLAVEQGRKVKNVFTGSLISLCANVPNFIFAIFITLATFVGSEESIISSIGGVCSFLAMSLEGMNTGVLSNHVYRFSAMDLTAQERKSIHGNNEKIRLECIARAVEFYIRLIRQC